MVYSLAFKGDGYRQQNRRQQKGLLPTLERTLKHAVPFPAL
ncbi:MULTISPECIES: hypothetical protein [Bifidobacterium]|nr:MULTISPECIES: hypothetical protein [Bifidobacterium]